MKKAVKHMCATAKYIPPQSFDTLVMAALACNEASSIGTTKGVREHVPSNINVLNSFIATYSRMQSESTYCINEQL